MMCYISLTFAFYKSKLVLLLSPAADVRTFFNRPCIPFTTHILDSLGWCLQWQYEILIRIFGLKYISGYFCLIIKLCLKSGLVGYSNLLLCTFVESFSRNRTNFYIVIWHKQIRVTWLWRLLILHTVSTVHITVQYRFWWGIWDICCFDGLFTFMIHVLLHDEIFVFADCRCWSYHFSTEKHAEPANANAQHCRSQRKLLVTNSHKRTLLLLGVNFVSSHLELPQINFHC